MKGCKPENTAQSDRWPGWNPRCVPARPGCRLRPNPSGRGRFRTSPAAASCSRARSPRSNTNVLCVAQSRQCQKILADALIADGEGVHPPYAAQQKAIQSARLLAVELGLSIVSRARSFQGKSADERDWGELEVG
jgi:hypothetical protein